VYGEVAPAASAPQQQAAGGTRSSSDHALRAAGGAAGARAAAAAADAFSSALGSAEAALMAAVVGTDEALAALPGGPVVGAGMAAGPPLAKLCFGVLLWEPLPRADLMQWPVWIEKQLHVVSGCHFCRRRGSCVCPCVRAWSARCCCAGANQQGQRARALAPCRPPS
jgi:hypothetical protein